MRNTPEASCRARKRWKQLSLYARTMSMFQRSSQYKCEGDPLWNTPEKKKIREAARHDPRVVAIIDRFWKILDMLKDEHGDLKCVSYIQLSVKLQKALLRDFDATDARICAQQDWDQDVGPHRTCMTEAEFRASMFEMADLWSETAEPSEYVWFLKNALEAVVKDIHSPELWFKEDDDIELIKDSHFHVAEETASVDTVEKTAGACGSRRRRKSLMGREVFLDAAVDAAVDRAVEEMPPEFATSAASHSAEVSSTLHAGIGNSSKATGEDGSAAGNSGGKRNSLTVSEGMDGGLIAGTFVGSVAAGTDEGRAKGKGGSTGEGAQECMDQGASKDAGEGTSQNTSEENDTLGALAHFPTSNRRQYTSKENDTLGALAHFPTSNRPRSRKLSVRVRGTARQELEQNSVGSVVDPSLTPPQVVDALINRSTPPLAVRSLANRTSSISLSETSPGTRTTPPPDITSKHPVTMPAANFPRHKQRLSKRWQGSDPHTDRRFLGRASSLAERLVRAQMLPQLVHRISQQNTLRSVHAKHVLLRAIDFNDQ